MRDMSQNLPDLPDSDVRVTAGQRQQAVRELREAAADERISFDELEGRLPAALNAKNRGDLHRVLGDLLPAAQLTTMFDEVVAESDAPGMSWEQPLLIKGDWKGTTKDGAWRAPPFIEVLCTGGCPLTLDFMEATPLVPVIDVVLTGHMNAKILVPEGWGADLQQLNIQGDMNYGVRSSVPTRPQQDQPRLIIRGAATGNVTVRHPNGWDRFVKRFRGQDRA